MPIENQYRLVNRGLISLVKEATGRVGWGRLSESGPISYAVCDTIVQILF